MNGTNMLWMKKLKLNGVDAWLCNINMQQNVKDNYSSNLKSMTKTISPCDHTYHNSYDGICE